MGGRLLIAGVLISGLVLTSTGAYAQVDSEGWHPSVTEATLLPKFCWKQFLGKKFSGPGFEIPVASCGVGTNHYCPGLVALHRVNGTFDDRMKRGYLQGALDQVGYTVKALEPYPHCPIRPEVLRTYNLIRRKIDFLQ